MAAAKKLITENLGIWTSAVKAKSSAGRGSSKSQELYGIQKLRKLILQLAVMGKLVPQDPDEGDAAADLAALISSRKSSPLKRTRIDSSVETELFPIPNNWDSVKLGEIASIRTGFAFKSADYSNTGTFILRVTNINPDGGFDTSNAVFLPENKLDEKMQGFSLQENELLVVMVGGSLGKIGQVTQEILPALLNQNMWRLLPYSERYCHRFLRLVLRDLNDNRLQVTASTHGHLAMGAYAASRVPFPPLAEQHRIVAKVDELMALCDQLEQEQESSLETHDTLVTTLLGALTNASANASAFAEAWQRIQANFDTLFTTESSIDQLKQTILQLAVMGKLVPQRPSDEPASKLLARINTEKIKLSKSSRTKRQKPLPTIPNAAIPFEQPKGWEWCYLKDIAAFENGDRSSKYPKKGDLVEQGIPFFGAPDIENGRLTYNPDLRFISNEKFSELSNGKLVNLDFVILLRGSVGKVAQFRETEQHHTGFINAQMLIIRLIDTNCCSYLYQYMTSTFFKNNITSEKSGAVIQQIPASKIASIKIPLPPLNEQRRIVAKVEELMKLCNRLKARLTTAQATQFNLADSLVERAIG